MYKQNTKYIKHLNIEHVKKIYKKQDHCNTLKVYIQWHVFRCDLNLDRSVQSWMCLGTENYSLC